MSVPKGPWLKVCAHKCNQCLFSKGKIVDDARRDEIVADLKERDTHFFCHKGTMIGVERVCHGSYLMRPQIVRFSERIGVLGFIDPDTGEPIHEPVDPDPSH